MNYRLTSVIGLFIFGVLLTVVEPTNLPDSFFAEAQARVGRPLTPVSYAGVARRTARRTVYATSTVYAAPTTVVVSDTYDDTYEQQQAAQAQQQALLPVGATLPSLPPGCGSNTVNSQSYFSCGGNWYRPAMQNGNIVYAVVADPR